MIEVTYVAKGVAPAELWEVMWRRTLTQHWLGSGSMVPAMPGHRLRLADRAGAWRQGTLVATKWGHSLEATLDPAPSWPVQQGVDALTFAVTAARGRTGAILRITETGPYTQAHADEIERFWQAVTRRLDRLLKQVADRRDSPRQAVVVIHGIGEQEPGRTLRALVDSGVIGEADSESDVRPDRVSDSFELRTVTFKATDGRVRPTTDVYELYWAHLIRDTTLAQVGSWASRLLLRRNIPRPLLPAWLLVWGVLLTLLVTAIGQLAGVWDLPSWLKAGGLMVVVGTLIWRLVGQGVVLDVLGDAARYLSPKPANIAHRQAIRSSGVRLVKRLHESGRYDRIVVLGHSLGSVIAYDVLTYAWLDFHTGHARPRHTDFTPISAMEKEIALPTDADKQQVQYDAWFRLRCNTQPWLVTDLITAGSPLTYAEFLMADSAEAFRAAQANRILPTCPPQTTAKGNIRRCTYETSYQPPDGGRKKTFVTPDHGAVFGFVRWTNLFFSVRWGGLSGDLVGGPIAPQFGSWVRDVPLASPVRRFAHTQYWRSSASGGDAHLAALNQALAMNCGQDLLSVNSLTPPFVIAERVVRSEE